MRGILLLFSFVGHYVHGTSATCRSPEQFRRALDKFERKCSRKENCMESKRSRWKFAESLRKQWKKCKHSTRDLARKKFNEHKKKCPECSPEELQRRAFAEIKKENQIPIESRDGSIKHGDLEKAASADGKQGGGGGSSAQQANHQGQVKPKLTGEKLKAAMTKYFSSLQHNKPLSATCSFNRGQPIRQDLERQNQKCLGDLSRAQQLCDTSTNKKLRHSLAEVRRSIAGAKKASRTSLKQSCERYRSSVSQLRGALRSFVSSCDPAQAKCQTNCYGTFIKTSDMALVSSSDPFCLDSPNIDSSLVKISRSAEQGYQQCQGFFQNVSRASDDAHELMDSEAMANLCKNQVASGCDSDDCNSHDDDGSGFADMRPLGTIDQKKGVGERADSSRAAANEPGASKKSGHREPASLTGPVAMGEGLSSAFDARSEVSSQIMESEQRVESLNDPHEKQESTDDILEEDATTGGRIAKDEDKIFQPNHPELSRYLPGGAKDPEANPLPDGITSENGKSLFEKISTRYRAHSDALDDFSSQIRSLDKKELVRRQKLKMTIQEDKNHRRRR